MKKQLRSFEVDFNFDWTYGVEIKKLREDLDALEKLGVTSIDIEAEDNWGSPSVIIKASVNRIETDAECITRINRENQRQEDIRLRELAEFEKLKLKYGR